MRAAFRSRCQALDSAGESLTFAKTAARAFPVLPERRLSLSIRFLRGMSDYVEIGCVGKVSRVIGKDLDLINFPADRRIMNRRKQREQRQEY